MVGCALGTNLVSSTYIFFGMYIVIEGMLQIVFPALKCFSYDIFMSIHKSDINNKFKSVSSLVHNATSYIRDIYI